jgi:hypothetical protein
MAIEKTIFSVPSGNVRGVILAKFGEGKKEKRIALATLFVDKDPTIKLSLPSKVTLRDVDGYADALKEFCLAVEEHS